VEIIRRLLLLVGLLGGLFAFIYHRPVLVSISIEDFAESKARAESQPTGFLHKDDTLQEFFDSRTRGRIQRVDGEAWPAFYEEVRLAASGEPGVTDLRRRLGDSEFTQRLYFLPDEAPMREFAQSLSDRTPLIYLQLEADGPGAPTLALIRHETGDLMDTPPAWLLKPLGPYATWLLAGGLGFYLLLPHPRRRADTIRCSTMSAVVMPDFLGAFLTGAFFALPLLVVQSNGTALSLDAGGWLIPIAIGWFLALFGVAILAVSCHGASLSIRFMDDALRVTTWHGSSLIAYQDVTRLEAVEWRTPRWVRTIGWLIVLVAQRGTISALILEQGRGSGLRLHLANGSSKRLWISGLNGWQRLVTTLEEHGAAVEPEVREMMEDV
jgi:hypothetical protein